MLLGVSKRASNNACRSELGIYPIRADAKVRAIKFYFRTLHQNNKLFPTLSHDVARDEIDDNGNTLKQNWTGKIKQILNKL